MSNNSTVYTTLKIVDKNLFPHLTFPVWSLKMTEDTKILRGRGWIDYLTKENRDEKGSNREWKKVNVSQILSPIVGSRMRKFLTNLDFF